MDPVSVGVTLGSSLLGGLFGGKKKKTEQSSKPYLMPGVEDAYVKSALPALMSEFQRPYEPPPMYGYEAPPSIFQGAWERRMAQPQEPVQQPQAAQQPAQAGGGQNINEIIGRSLMATLGMGSGKGFHAGNAYRQMFGGRGSNVMPMPQSAAEYSALGALSQVPMAQRTMQQGQDAAKPYAADARAFLAALGFPVDTMGA